MMSTQNTTSSNHLNSALSKLTSLVDNNFECSICLDTYSDPHVIPECLHRFCGGCVKESIRKCGAECPKCRARITTRRGLRKDNDFQDMMSMVLTAVEHLNQATAEATDISERCAIKTEETAVTDTANEEGATTSTNGGNTSIGSASLSNANVDSGSMAFGSGEADSGDSGSVTVASSSNAQQQAVSIAGASSNIKTRVIMPLRSKRVTKGLCEERFFDQDGGGHSIDMIVVGNNDRHVVGQEVQSRKTSDEHNSDNAEMMSNQESNAVIRSNDIDKSAARGITRKRKAEDSPLKSRKKGKESRNESFEGREKQLVDFKDKFGHCHVPCKYPVDPALGNWCNSMRSAYRKIRQGHTPTRNLTQDQIERLEEIGFKWELAFMTTFEQRCHDLEVFKSDFGHCNVIRKYSANPSLGNWCNAMRSAYNKIQQGQTTDRNLTPDRIARLEEIGFKWKVTNQARFENRFNDLEVFKSDFGHCNVSRNYSADPSLGKWCKLMRSYYNQIQQGLKPKSNLTQDQIERLEEIGFKWKLR